MASGDGPGVGPIVGAGMVLLVVVALAMFAMKSGPNGAASTAKPAVPASNEAPAPPRPPAVTTVAPLAPASSTPIRFNDSANTARYEARRKALDAIKAALPDVPTKGDSLAPELQKKCDDATADLTMLDAEPNQAVRAFVDGFKRTCEYDVPGAALDFFLARIAGARAKAPAARPADCARGEPFTKAIVAHHYEDDPAMKDRLDRFARGCL
jgi:hypothetical protein